MSARADEAPRTDGASGVGETAGARGARGAVSVEDAVREVVHARRSLRVRTNAVTAALAAGVVVALCVALSYGDVVIPLPDLLATLGGGGNGGTRFVLFDLRLPRAVTGLLVGIAFGMSGAVFQTLLRNPLASPDVIGISAGASSCAVLATMVLGLSGFALSLSALVGAVLAAVLIYALAWRRGVTGYRLVLVGIGVGALLSSLISYLMTNSEVTEAQTALVWLAGSLNERTWSEVWPLLAALVVLLPATLLTARTLRPLELGDEAATGLGNRVQWSRLGLLGCAVALAGVATAAAGPVAFVAFVSAPIARRLMPGRGPALVPAALTGALVVLVADFAAQHLLGPTQFPVGVITSVVGAPYLLWLLGRTNRVGRGG